MQKARLPSPSDHPSYHKHRRQLWTQILVPLLLTFVALAALGAVSWAAATNGDEELSRWAAISTVWVVIPFMIAGLIFFILFAGLIYLMMRFIKIIPPYTGKAQKFMWRVEGTVKRGADAVVRPILGVEGFAATVKKLFGMK